MSRASSLTSSWQEVITDDPGSPDDYTDIDDGDLIAVAPRSTPIVFALSHPSYGRLPRPRSQQCGLSNPHGPTAAPEPAVMLRDDGGCHAGEEGPAMRLRRTNSVGPPAFIAEHDMQSGVASSSDVVGDSHGQDKVPGRGPAADMRRSEPTNICGIATDGDHLWTFLAGMLLYMASA